MNGAEIIPFAPRSSDSRSPSRIVSEFVEAYNRRDFDGMARLLDPEAQIGWPNDVSLGAEMIGILLPDLWEEFPEMRMDLVSEIAAEDCVSRVHHVTGQGDYTSLATYRVEDGRITAIVTSA